MQIFWQTSLLYLHCNQKIIGMGCDGNRYSGEGW